MSELECADSALQIINALVMPRLELAAVGDLPQPAVNDTIQVDFYHGGAEFVVRRRQGVSEISQGGGAHEF